MSKAIYTSFICSTCQRNLYKYTENKELKIPFGWAAIYTVFSTCEYGLVISVHREERHSRVKLITLTVTTVEFLKSQ